MTAIEKLQKARAELILDQVFFGSLLLRLVFKEDSSFKTLWVDGVAIGYNPQFILSLDIETIKGCLVHEVGHLILSHHTRRGSRDCWTWNKAADYAVNPIVLNGGFRLPDGCLVNSDFNSKSADEIYSIIHKASDEKKVGAKPSARSGGEDGKGKDKDGEGQAGEDKDGKGKTKGGKAKTKDEDFNNFGEVRDCKAEDGGEFASEADKTKQEADWKVAVAQAAQQAKGFGCLPAGMTRVVDEILNPKVDWREVLKRFIDSASKSDYSWQTPNRRYIHRGLYLPSSKNMDLGTVVIAIDTSGSIDVEELNRACSEMAAIVGDFRAEVYVVYCDCRISHVDHFESGDFPKSFNTFGGGGTSFKPVFEWVETEKINASCMIYFTDLDGEFPEQEPTYPVLWVSSRKVSEWLKKEFPFGELLEIY